MKIKFLPFVLLILFLVADHAFAEEQELFFTYIGPVIGAGTNQIAYRRWSQSSDSRESSVVSGYFVSGGFLMNIYVRDFIGEFTLEYIADQNSEEPDLSIMHLIYTSQLKYSYSLNEQFALTCGAGAYLETSPATKTFDSGGGINGSLGLIYSFSREMKLVVDLPVCRYGYYGVGDDSSKLSFGVKLGMVWKVGRI
ncbi:MAG: hypothetical protein JW864_09515 [Spirochaetes bacterium]|nr:hypothetical protein [Spirochaetota bacterium]